MFSYSNIVSRCVKNACKNSERSISFRTISKLYSIYFHRSSKSSKPPYDHICQIGDPVLRNKASPIDKKVIETQEFQKTLEHLHKVMKKYETVGLAAPQIGFPWQVFAIEVTENALKDISPQMQNLFHMETQPLTFFINPKLEIINPTEVISHEICGSISCYQAEVPRAKEVQITALNRFGEPFCWKGKDWLARIAQHEMDHLHGILYVDRMFPLTFEYCHWENINKNDGKVVLD